jgi:S-adenosylmethionine:tRNA ribosyltransferase-isomerase
VFAPQPCAPYKAPVRTSDFDFPLPENLIAQTPAPTRDQSRLLVLHRDTGEIEHRRFSDLPEFLRSGDVLVLNDSRVIPARLRGVTGPSQGPLELLLLSEEAPNDWWVMVKPGKRARIGSSITLRRRSGEIAAVQARITDKNAEGHRRAIFSGAPDIADLLDDLGEVPLPPYIRRHAGADLAADRQRYQTVFARAPGSVAAPTAGLHFTPELLDAIRARGVQVCCVTLHVGLGTFAPVKAEHLAGHVMHEERFSVSPDTAQTVNAAWREGRRAVAVGTTAVRVLESLAPRHGQITAGAGTTRLFLHPPAGFRVVGALLTNFHLPRSTLLMLVSAFAAPGETRGRELVLAAYAEAVRQRYRFFSYGDAMLIL